MPEKLKYPFLLEKRWEFLGRRYLADYEFGKLRKRKVDIPKKYNELESLSEALVLAAADIFWLNIKLQ